ncbi:MAG: response regulator transcription factor [Longimicrobiales bacterium]
MVKLQSQVSDQGEREASRILRIYGGDPSCSASTGAALERFFSKLGKRFGPLVGRDGYRALLQEAHRGTVKKHPVLERYPVAREGNPFFGGLHAGLESEEPGEVWAALTGLVDEFLSRAGALGRSEELALRTGKTGRDPTRGIHQDVLIPGPSLDRRLPEEMLPDDSGELPLLEAHAREEPRLSRPWRILIMDRDRVTCEALAGALGGARDFDVVEWGLSAKEVKQKVGAEDIDFVVVSAHLPPAEVLEVCRWFRQEFPEKAPYIVVTGLPPDPATALRFLEAGSSAFTMEDFSVQGLRLTLRLLARGETVFPLRLQHLISLRLSELAELVRDRGLNPETLSSLTAREGEVLMLLDEGLTNREIAKKLFISEGTVKSHVHQILRKLKVRDRMEAVRVLRLQRAAPGKLVLTRTGFRKVDEEN